MKMRFASFKGCFSEHCGVDHVGRPLISPSRISCIAGSRWSVRAPKNVAKSHDKGKPSASSATLRAAMQRPVQFRTVSRNMFAYRTEPHPRGCEAIHCARLSGGFSIIPASRQLVAQDHHKSVRERCSEDARWRDALPRKAPTIMGRDARRGSRCAAGVRRSLERRPTGRQRSS
jgi:hypothetical protein